MKPVVHIALAFAVSCLVGCEKRAQPPTPPNPNAVWEQKLKEIREEYEKDQQKLQSDWRLALQDALKGDLDADQLAKEISDLRHQIEIDRNKIRDWDEQVKKQLAIVQSGGAR